MAKIRDLIDADLISPFNQSNDPDSAIVEERKSSLLDAFKSFFLEQVDPSSSVIGGVAKNILGKSPEELPPIEQSAISGISKLASSVVRVPAFLYQSIPQGLSVHPGIAPSLPEEAKEKLQSIKIPEFLLDNPVTQFFDDAAQSYDYIQREYGVKTPQIEEFARKRQEEGFEVTEVDLRKFAMQASEDFSTLVSKGDYARAGDYLVNQVVANAPYQIMVLSMIMAGAPHAAIFATMGAPVAAQSLKETEDRDDITEKAKFQAALLKGVAEGFFETAFEVPIFNWARNLFKTVGSQNGRIIIKNSVKAILGSAIGEGIEEVATQISQDLTDKYFQIEDGLTMEMMIRRSIDAGMIGGLSGALMTAPSSITNGLLESIDIKNRSNGALDLRPTRQEVVETLSYLRSKSKGVKDETGAIVLQPKSLTADEVELESILNGMLEKGEYLDPGQKNFEEIAAKTGYYTAERQAKATQEGRMLFDMATPQEFQSARARSVRPQFLTPYRQEELGSMRLFLNQEGTVGYALTREGDMVNVFNNSTVRGAGKEAVIDAIKNGAKTLDAFEGFLPDYYAQFGFEAYKAEPFNQEFAPENWDYAKLGEPDIIYMRYKGGDRDTIEQRIGQFKPYQHPSYSRRTPSQREVVEEIDRGEGRGVGEEAQPASGRAVAADTGARPAAQQPAEKRTAVKFQLSPQQKSSAIFYSVLEKRIQERMPETASADQIRGIIKEGIKQEELDYSAIQDFISGKQKISKQDLLDFIRENQIQIKEIEKSKEEGAKFDRYVLPGGGNYKELLLLLPTMQGKTGFLTVKQIDQNTFILEDSAGNEYGHTWETKQAAQNQADVLNAKPTAFRTPHFDEPNVLAHVRFNERLDSKGNRVLFLEEVQSDWHQLGRKEGYAEPPLTDSEKAEMRRFSMQLEENSRGRGEPLTEAENARWSELTRRNQDDLKIPDAPFKKTWHELALKRMLRYAIDRGFDSIAWTTGEQQADRYDLSKQLMEVKIAPNKSHIRRLEESDLPNRIDLEAFDKSGKKIINQVALRQEELSDFIGKELANKAIEQGISERQVVFGGLDLKVGGEGIKSFYDQIIPQFLNRYSKKFGAKVDETTLQGVFEEVGVGYHSEALIKRIEGTPNLRPVKVHSIEITDSMRRDIVGGQPLFQREKISAEIPKQPTLTSNEAVALVREFFSEEELPIDIVDRIVTPEGWDAYGKYDPIRGMITFVKNPLATTPTHEVVHAFFDMFVDPYKQGQILQEVKEFNEITDDAEAEELLADAFIEYVRYRKKPKSISDRIRQFFDDLIQAIRKLFGQESKVRDFYDAVISKKRPKEIAPTIEIIADPAYQERPEDGEKIRKFIDQVKRAQKTKEEVRRRVHSTYVPITNQQTLDRANEIIEKDWNEAMSIALSDDPPTALSNAVAIRLIDILQERGQFAEAINIVNHTAEKATSQGQAIQALSLYSRLSPEGIILFAQREIGKANKRYKEQGKTRRITLDPDVAKALREEAKELSEMPEGRDKTIRTAKVFKKIQEQIPPSGAKVLSALQTIAQLLNPKTFIRNFVGNIGFMVLENVNDVVGTAIDRMVAIKTGKRTRTVPNILAQVEGFRRGIVEGIQDAISGVDTKNVATRFDLPKTQIFKDGTMLHGLEVMLNISLRATDRAFYQAAYDQAMRNQLAAANLKSEEDASPEQLEEFIIRAHFEGLYRTFQDDNALSRGFVTIKRSLNEMLGFGRDENGRREFGLGDMVIKYPKTPANLLARGLEYSPISFFFTVSELVRPLVTDTEFNQQKFIDVTSRAITGSSLLVGAGFILAALGIITGRRDDDRDLEAVRRQVGLGAYRINIDALFRFFMSAMNPNLAQFREGDRLISYDWFQPQAINLAIGADLYTGGTEKKDRVTTLGEKVEQVPESVFRVGESVIAASETIVEQPVLTGIQRMTKYGLIDGVQKTFEEIPASFVPTFLNQIRQLMDNTARNTMDPKFFGRVWNRVAYKIPYLSKNLEPRVTVWGEDQEMYQDASNNPFNVFLNPAFTSKYKPTPEAKMVLNIWESTGIKTQMPRVAPKTVVINGARKELNARQYTEYQRYIGHRTGVLYRALAENEKFMSLGHEEQAKELSGYLQDINTAAKILLFGHRPEKLPKDVKSIIKSETPEEMERMAALRKEFIGE